MTEQKPLVIRYRNTALALIGWVALTSTLNAVLGVGRIAGWW